MERAFDPVKYRRVPDRPILELYLPPEGEGGRAPQGKAVASILVHSLPTEPEGGWTDQMRSRLGERVLELLEARVPGLGSLVLARKVLAPPDIEREYGVTGGHLHHGEHALDQLLVRPVPECQGYATPVEGLYLCGMGSHPGGGLTCLPARNAAAVILSGRASGR